MCEMKIDRPFLAFRAQRRQFTTKLDKNVLVSCKLDRQASITAFPISAIAKRTPRPSKVKVGGYRRLNETVFILFLTN
ncbi:hypothetical protein T11_7815 [Trichinella zimbabwensis]|uniref:Uncharacterized protein n=1 Tax=Trichinella zimbabwensis TaxID=268475 RepID=A0A0V1HYY5_9BILA|nr:hypothetical protein T11_7815 [Trichinella zimbabwensis]